MKPNIGVGKANKPKAVKVKVTDKYPIKGDSKNVAIFHMTRGKKGKI